MKHDSFDDAPLVPHHPAAAPKGYYDAERVRDRKAPIDTQ
jgi:hypothetical protein